MASTDNSNGSKRKPDDRTISPPPLKRKGQASISKSAVANFFTPSSQKPKERTIWSERGPDDKSTPTLLVGRYEPEQTAELEERQKKRRKIAAFDLDSTLITSASGKKHSDSATDWKWWDGSVPGKLQEMYHKEGYQVVVLSNQGGITLHPDADSKGPKNLNKNRLTTFKQKVGAVLTQLNLPVTVYAATGKDIYRKPRPGMWKEVSRDYELEGSELDLEQSIFVGDAGGRVAGLKTNTSGAAVAVAKDFSCSDRNFAHNVGIPYQTPEEFFLGEKPRNFERDFDPSSFPFTEAQADDEGTSVEVLFEKKHKQELVLFCGPPGAGKSTFYWTYLKPLGFERINQDTLKSRDKCFKVAAEKLGQGDSVAVDNTNPDADGRSQWINLAKKHKVPIRCVWFKTPLGLCKHNDTVRALNANLNPESRTALPDLAFNGFKSRFKQPKANEGFDDVVEVDFKFRGTREEYGSWGRYWV